MFINLNLKHRKENNMKQSELQIGDWVFYYAGYDKEQSCNSRITGILTYPEDTIFLEVGGGEPFCSDEIYPILITPEILERNDFKKEKWSTSLWKRNLGYNRWCDMSAMEGKWYFRIKDDGLFTYVKEVRYVHNLQHLFRDYDIEQEWKIEQSDDTDWKLIN